MSSFTKCLFTMQIHLITLTDEHGKERSIIVMIPDLVDILHDYVKFDC